MDRYSHNSVIGVDFDGDLRVQAFEHISGRLLRSQQRAWHIPTAREPSMLSAADRSPLEVMESEEPE